MSIHVMTLVWDRYPGTGGELLLALKLADHAHDDGAHIYPTVENLMHSTRQSRRGVQQQLRRMESSGFLVVTEHAQGGRGHAREYSVNPRWLTNPAAGLPGSVKVVQQDAVDAQDGVKGAPDAPFTNAKGRTQRQERAHLSAPFTKRPYKALKPSLIINAHARGKIPKGGNPPGFDLFWAAWPRSTHKKRRPEALAEWVKQGAEAESERVLAHVAAAIAGSDSAVSNGGQYLLSPKHYLRNAEWREPFDAKADDPNRHVCVVCGAEARCQIGWRHLCGTHFDERAKLERYGDVREMRG